MKLCQGLFYIFSLTNLFLDLGCSTTYSAFAKSHTNPFFQLLFLPLNLSVAKTGVSTFYFFIHVYEWLQFLPSLQWFTGFRAVTPFPHYAPDWKWEERFLCALQKRCSMLVKGRAQHWSLPVSEADGNRRKPLTVLTKDGKLWLSYKKKKRISFYATNKA